MKYRISLLVLLVSMITYAQFVNIGKESKNVIFKEFEEKSVRIVYLVSSDREVENDYLLGIEKAAISVQNFYRKELNGLTFKLNQPVVEVLRCNEIADYFYTNPSDVYPEN